MVNSRITRSIDLSSTDSSLGIFQYITSPQFLIGTHEDIHSPAWSNRRPISHRRRR
jgi:hypothetical protein